ncbi:MAG: HEAT repeat domain-containing protein [Elusimicrobia bacterium]|nr:HEAT repeat domain-containing protein [Elusimicrobiota bacterium]
MLSGTLAILLAAGAAASERAPSRPLPVPSQPTAQSLVGEMELIVKAAEGLHPLAARDLDARLAPYLGRLRALGPRALPLLTWYLRQDDRPRKVRLHAAAALGLIADPGALPALRATAEDKKADPGLRSACVQSLGGLRLAAHEKRGALDRFLAEGLPETVTREALVQLAGVGTDRVARAAALARALGAAPEGAAALTAGAAAEALGRSPDPSADGALIALLAFWRTGAAPRGPALAALARRRVEKRTFNPSRAQLDVILAALAQESGANALSAARLLGLIGDRRAVGSLIRLLKAAPEAAVAAEAAAALAAIGDPAARKPVGELAAGLATDARFGAEPGGATSGPLAATIEAASSSLGGAAPKTPPVVAAVVEHYLPAPAPTGFVYDGWPGSGRPRPVASAERTLILYATPEVAARVVLSIPARAGAPIELAGSKLISRRSGWARARAPMTLEARTFGAVSRLSRTEADGPVPRAELTLAEGELLEVLAPRAEGDCFVRRGGAVHEAACPHLDRERFEVIEEPFAEWWLELKTASGSGWVNAEDPALTILRD